MLSPRIAVVILNWNGKKFLQQFLPVVIEKSPNSEIYVADNASTDDSVEFLKNNFPEVELIRNPDNSGFAGGYNQALNKIKADYYVLLNSDVEVTSGWIDPIISFMEAHPNVAACQPKILDYFERDKFEYAGACGGFIDYLGYPFCRGRIFSEIERDNGQYEDSIPVFWATGACMFIRSKSFWECNGFDEDLFAHMEEIDLCWRMKNRGLKIYVVPSSKVFHVGGGTLEKSNPFKTYLNFRNSLVVLAKNSTDGILLVKVLLRLILDGVAGIKFLMEGRPVHVFSIVKAHWSFFFGVPKLLKKRKKSKPVNNNKCILQSSIVLDFYLRGRKKYSQINW